MKQGLIQFSGGETNAVLEEIAYYECGRLSKTTVNSHIKYTETFRKQYLVENLTLQVETIRFLPIFGIK